jgi:hypothetical protein
VCIGLVSRRAFFMNGSVSCGIVWGGDFCFWFSRSCFLLWLFSFSPLCCSGSVVLFLGAFVYCNSEVPIVLLPGSFSSLCMTCTQS